MAGPKGSPPLCARCARYKANLQAKRAAWRAAGLCPECGADKPRDRFKRCLRCRSIGAADKRAARRVARTRLGLKPYERRKAVA
jgi:hypothetical protein